MARSDMIVIEIGGESVKYRVHEGLLVHHSEYFRRALNGRWQEADDRVVLLGDVESDTFGLFVEWLYTQRLSFPMEDEVQKTDDPDFANMQILRLKLCALSDRLQCSKLTRSLRRHITTQLIEYEPVKSRLVIFSFENLDTDHPFLQLLVDVCSQDAKSITFQDAGLSEDVPRSFLLRAIDRLAFLSKNSNTRCSGDLRGCDYHGHSSDEDRKLCQTEEAAEERCEDCGK